MLSVSRYISCTTSQNSDFNCRNSTFPCASVHRDQIWLKINLHLRKLKIKYKHKVFSKINLLGWANPMKGWKHKVEGREGTGITLLAPMWSQLMPLMSSCLIWTHIYRKHTGNSRYQKQLATCQHIIILDKSHCWLLDLAGVVCFWGCGFSLRLPALYSTWILGKIREIISYVSMCRNFSLSETEGNPDRPRWDGRKDSSFPRNKTRVPE